MLKDLKFQARNADKADLRNVIENLTDAVLDMYKVFNGKMKPTEVKKKPIKRKAKPKQLSNM